MASPANQGQLRVDGSIVERQHAPGERGPTKQGAHDLTSPTFDEPTRNALVETMYAAGSDLLILPIQDVFGWRDRINVPGHVSDRNWTFKLPWPVDRLESEPAAVACAERLRTWAERHGRI